MKHNNYWMAVAALITVGLLLSVSQQSLGMNSKIEPVHIEHIEGSELSRVTLTEKAMERLGIKMALVRESQVTRKGPPGNPVTLAGLETKQKVVPYSSMLYGVNGESWVYISPKPRTFVRHHITVDFIEGDQVFLTEGPPSGTEVVTVGAAELFGAEFEIGH